MDSLRTILDTSVVIGNRLDEIDGELAISAITLAELHFGVLVASDLQARALRLQRLIAVERRFEPLAVDARVAGSYGNLASVVRSTGRRPRARASHDRSDRACAWCTASHAEPVGPTGNRPSRTDRHSARRELTLPISSFGLCLPRWSAMPQRTRGRSYRGRHNTALHD